MTRDQIVQIINRRKIITIVRGIYGEQITALARALADGGIKLMEVTFDQQAPDEWSLTAEAIRGIRTAVGDEMTVGAGTVTSVALVEMANAAGAQFIVSPDTNVEIIRRTLELGMVSVPGALTSTEAITAYRAGADFVKIFPVAQLGTKYIAAIRAPLNQIPMLAVGGVNENNLASFLAAGCAGVGVGGSLVNAAWVANGEFEKITSLARRYCAIVSKENS